MPEDGRKERAGRSAALPRRVPGSAGFTSGRGIRRGVLPAHALKSAAGPDGEVPAQAESAGSEPAQIEPVQVEPVQIEPVQAEPVQIEAVQAEPARGEPAMAALPTAAALPRRAPGASAIQAPPAAQRPSPSERAGRRPDAPAEPAESQRTAASAGSAAAAPVLSPSGTAPPAQPPAAPARSPSGTAPPAPAPPAVGQQAAAASTDATSSPAARAASAASLVRATAAATRTFPATGPAVKPAQSAPPPAASLQTPARPAPQPADAPPAQKPAQPARPPRDRGRAGRRPSRWQIAGLVVAVLLAVAAIVAVGLGRRPAAPAGTGSGLIAGETAIRGQAVSWITTQVGHDIVLACDAVVCADLAQHGFPAGNLNVLQPTAPDPYGSEVLIASADIRSQFGAKLGFYAPTVIASFGTGAGHIDVRVIAADGAKFGAALRQDLQARKSSGAELAGNPGITVSAAARAELLSGGVDTRLLTALAFLAGQEPISIVAFGSFAPGAAPGVPQRWAYLAETDPAAHASAAAYLQSLISFAHQLRPPYVPLSLGTVQLPGGRNVLRIEFAAPSPLGLLRS